MNTSLETGDTLVVTVPVPTTDAQELSLWIEGTVVHVLGPGGFRRQRNLPEGADGSRLQAGLFGDILELRAPRTARPPSLPLREVEVQPLS